MSQIPSSVSQESEEPESSRPECPICFHGLPIRSEEHVYHACCGQVICNGCVVGKQRTQLKEPQYKKLGQIVEGTTPEEEQFRLIDNYGNNIYVCPYCRTPPPYGDQELLQRLYDRIEIRNDSDYSIALIQLGSHHEHGEHGLPQNLAKAEELYKKSYELDHPSAAWNLYCLYHNNYPDQKKKEMEYLQRGEILGSLDCIQALTKRAYDSDDEEELTRLCVKLARLGGDTSNLLKLYRHNLLSKNDLATTFRANQAVKDELKTKRRDFAERFMEFLDKSLQKPDRHK